MLGWKDICPAAGFLFSLWHPKLYSNIQVLLLAISQIAFYKFQKKKASKTICKAIREYYLLRPPFFFTEDALRFDGRFEPTPTGGTCPATYISVSLLLSFPALGWRLAKNTQSCFHPPPRQRGDRQCPRQGLLGRGRRQCMYNSQKYALHQNLWTANQKELRCLKSETPEWIKSKVIC